MDMHMHMHMHMHMDMDMDMDMDMHMHMHMGTCTCVVMCSAGHVCGVVSAVGKLIFGPALLMYSLDFIAYQWVHGMHNHPENSPIEVL